MLTELINQTITGSKNRALVYDVYYEKRAMPQPVILFCHGYKGFKDWGAWNLMGKTFANAGFVFIKFNYSHNGGTATNPIDFPDLEAFGNNNYSFEVSDTKIMLDWILQANLPIDKQQINLMGHSRAGGITTIVSASDLRIHKLITLAGVSDYAARFPKGKMLKQWKAQGVTYIENGRTKQQMPLYYQFYQDFKKNKEQLHILNAAASLTIPHLIIHGDADPTVKIDEAMRLHKASNKSQLHIIKGANHVFGASHPWSLKFLPQDLQRVVQCVINFVMK